MSRKTGHTPRNYLTVARGAGWVLVRVMGTGNMITAAGLNEFAEHQRLAGFRRFVFDLSQCRGFDSTFMGCMVGIHSALKRDTEREALSEAKALDASTAEARERGSEVELEPLSREEAMAALNEFFSRDRSDDLDLSELQDAHVWPAETFVVAVNVSAECLEMMNILGVDNFVSVLGPADLQAVETTLLPESEMPADERRKLILKAHENLVELDKRNEVRFGAFLKTLSAELAKKNS